MPGVSSQQATRRSAAGSRRSPAPRRAVLSLRWRAWRPRSGGRAGRMRACRRPLCACPEPRPGRARRAVQRGDRPFQVVGDRVELGQRVVVAEQPEAEVAVVAHHGDAERLARGERHDRVQPAQFAAEQVERELRPGHVGDDEVEELLACLQPRGLAEDRRRREAGEVRQHLCADRLPGVLQVLHRRRDRVQRLGGRLDADRQRRPHRRDLVAERSALGLGAHRDRHHRLQHEAVGIEALAAQVAPERERDGGQDGVVQGAAERVLDAFEARRGRRR